MIDCPIDQAPPAGLADGGVEAKPPATVVAKDAGPINDTGVPAPPGAPPDGGWTGGAGGFDCGSSADEVFGE
ncbi:MULTISPECIES: hypothetical protein [Nannocystis]|uniref:Uncharacterized protein n=1 Tax=Nannocystis radixulma TaxID=2995305 RepID=A0ABT5BDY3_9BACT|nr:MULTISPECIES: hypothetical protein [Nannocystis]MCY1059373.1 hypothetical protein [Nannocystis sp. SCPEA4]MDC0672346.1 hypothetical protein [Nannocystis radixulma]